MAETIDVGVLKKNCEDYANSSTKAINVLRNANGKRSYKDISKIVGLNAPKVSSLLKKSEKLGLSEKNDDGFYHRKPGIMGYMPRTVKKRPHETQQNKKLVLEKVTNKIHKISKKAKYVRSAIKIIGADSVAKMEEAYSWLYLTENTIRELIRNVLGPTYDWWKAKVNSNIQKNVEEAMRNYPYDGAKRNDELEYAHLGELKEIIISKQNWPVFQSSLNEKDKDKFRATIDKAIPTRNSIGHCIPLKGDDLKEVEVRFKDILKMIK